jgi:hypothetical protein
MIPLEREYEGWTVAQLENALERLGVRFAIAAVSPMEERNWPADEALSFQGKVIGIQFKRPHQVEINRQPTAAWSLHSRYDQLAKIKKIQEIYYALPAFLNRRMKPAALHACLFWRPGPRHVKLTIDHSYARSKSLSSGEFIQGLVDCRLGRRPPGHLPVSWYAKLLSDAMAGRVPLPSRDGTWSRASTLREFDIDAPFDSLDKPKDEESNGVTRDANGDDYSAFYLIAIETEGGESIHLG